MIFYRYLACNFLIVFLIFTKINERTKRLQQGFNVSYTTHVPTVLLINQSTKQRTKKNLTNAAKCLVIDLYYH